jgi:hypothetical protein
VASKREGRHHAEADGNSIPPRINAGSPAKADEKDSDFFQTSINNGKANIQYFYTRLNHHIIVDRKMGTL